MRYDTEHKERTRQRVLSEAAAAIRAHGPDRIGVAAIMAKAGLTHGGFYAHFKSKDDLVAQSVSQMFDLALQRFGKLSADPDPAAGLRRYIQAYLSEKHRDQPEHGCPMPTLSGDLARMPPEARERFRAGMDRLVDAQAAHLALLGRPHARPLAVAMLAQMVGAVSLSRAVDDPALSAQILQATCADLLQRLGLAG